MASDTSYASFLEKANEDPNNGIAKSQGKKVDLKTLDEGVVVPEVLKEATRDAWYVSDADERFEPVVLGLKGKGLPDESNFASLINHPTQSSSNIEILDIGQWDPKGEYKALVDAVREATKGADVRVYRVPREGSRVEYWVVGFDGERVLGVKALGVES